MPPLLLDQTLALAISHHNAGRLPQAESLYRQILQHVPNHPDALHLLGLLAHQVKRDDVALDLISQAIAANPNVANFHNSLGEIHRQLGNFPQALVALDRSLQLAPHQTASLNNRGLVLQAQGQHDHAIATFLQAIALDPNAYDAHNNLGTAYKERGRSADALACYRKALALNPQYIPALNNLGVALFEADQIEDAAAIGQQAAQLAPNLPEAHHNLGLPQIKLNRLPQAIASWQHAISLRPDYADAHFNLGLALLLQGDYLRGWAEHEWRWRCRDLPKARPFTQPQYDGSPASALGRTILLHAEQGFGDTFQFIRFIPQLAAQLASSNTRLLLEAQPELLTLLQRSPILSSIAQFIPTGSPLPSFDLQLPLMSLPFVLKNTLETLPHEVPYLTPDPEKVAHFQTLLAPSLSPPSPVSPPLLKVGLVWAGRPAHTNDRHRSIPPPFLVPLATIPSVQFVMLQKGPAAAAPPFPMLDLTAQFHSFDDTAALIANLDLILTVDTSIAHLAGALAKPVWTLLPFSPDWRWLLGRSDSPWYPTMRLFRQPSQGNWPAVIQAVTTHLQHHRSSLTNGQ